MWNTVNLTVFGKLLAAAFDDYVEEHLIQPVHITEHPIEVSPLSKLDPKDPRYTIRFESYIYGRNWQTDSPN